MNNNDFETLGIDNNQNINNDPNANPVNPSQDLEQTAENIINQVNQEINNTPVNPEPVAEPVVEPAPAPAPEAAPAPVQPEQPAVAEPAPAPAEPVPQATVAAQEPVADPNAVQEDLSNISYDTKDNYNEFANEKPKKKVSLSSIIILIVLLLGLGGAVYYSVFYKDIFGLGLGNGGSSSEPLAAKEVTIELGTEIPTDITIYMNRALNATEYKLVTNKIDNNKVGEYKFDVIYNGNTYSGTAKVTDTVAPVLTTKEVTAQSANDVVVGDFVENCEDLSGCTIDFETPLDAATFAEEGTYTIVIVAKDEYGNEVKVNANLVIDASATAVEKLTCTKSRRSDDYAASIVYEYEFTFDEDSNYASIVDKRTYTFDTTDELAKHKEANTNNDGTYDEAVLTHKSSKSYTVDQAASDSTLSKFPKAKADLQKFFVNNGFTCK